MTLETGASVCDLACGTGHLALSFATCAGRLVGVDPAPSMLDAFRRLAAERGIERKGDSHVLEEESDNVTTVT